MAETRYVVLAKNDDPTLPEWAIIGAFAAGSSDQAAKMGAAHDAAENGVRGGTYVAVPERSFKPVDLVPEATPRFTVRSRSSA